MTPTVLSDGQLKLFISYAWPDLATAETMVSALETRGFTVTFDRQDLPFNESGQAERARLIRAADVVLWLTSPSATKSKWCRWAAAEAQRQGKRLVIVRVQVDPAEQAEPGIRASGVPQTGIFDPDQHMTELVDVLSKDGVWIREGTRLATRAYQWIEHQRPEALLHSAELAAAEAWLTRRPPDHPRTGDGIAELALASRRGSAQPSRWLTGALGALALAALGYAWSLSETRSQLEISGNVARRQAETAAQQASEAATLAKTAETALAAERQAREAEAKARAAERRDLAAATDARTAAETRLKQAQDREAKAIAERDAERRAQRQAEADRKRAEQKITDLELQRRQAEQTAQAADTVRRRAIDRQRELEQTLGATQASLTEAIERVIVQARAAPDQRTLKRVLDAGEASLKRLSASPAADPSRDIVALQIRNALTVSYRAFGHSEAQLASAADGSRRAEDVLAKSSDRIPARHEAAMGHLHLGHAHREQGRLQDAYVATWRATTMLLATPVLRSTFETQQRLLGQAHLDLAITCRLMGDLACAARRGLTARQALAFGGAGPPAIHERMPDRQRIAMRAAIEIADAAADRGNLTDQRAALEVAARLAESQAKLPDRRPDAPLDRANIADRLSALEFNVGHHDKARTVGAQTAQRRQQLERLDQASLPVRRALAETAIDDAVDEKERSIATRLLTDAINSTEALLTEDAGHTETRLSRARAYAERGLLAARFDDHEAALKDLRQALDQLRKLEHEDPFRRRTSHLIARRLMDIGDMYRARGDRSRNASSDADHQSALKAYQETLAICTGLLSYSSASLEWQACSARASERIGDQRENAGETGLALDAYRKAHRQVLDMGKVAAAHKGITFNLAILERKLGDTIWNGALARKGNDEAFEAARPHYLNFHEMMRALHEHSADHGSWMVAYATSYERLGNIRIGNDRDVQGALAAYRACVDLLDRKMTGAFRASEMTVRNTCQKRQWEMEARARR